jgi:hypothetical protein
MKTGPVLNFETLHAALDGKAQWLTGAHAYRAKVPGGWLVFMQMGTAGGMVFYPDLEHRWDGGTLPDYPSGNQGGK